MNPATIRTLHAAYVAASGQAVALNMDRERTWAEWLRWRPEAPFTEQDLRDVIYHLRRGIKDGARNVGALRFRNLIGSPDYFEEELALIRAKARPRPPVEHKVSYVTPTSRTERILPASGNENATKPAAAHVEGCLEKLKGAIR